MNEGQGALDAGIMDKVQLELWSYAAISGQLIIHTPALDGLLELVLWFAILMEGETFVAWAEQQLCWVFGISIGVRCGRLISGADPWDPSFVTAVLSHMLAQNLHCICPCDVSCLGRPVFLQCNVKGLSFRLIVLVTGTAQAATTACHICLDQEYTISCAVVVDSPGPWLLTNWHTMSKDNSYTDRTCGVPVPFPRTHTARAVALVSQDNELFFTRQTDKWHRTM